MLDTTPVIIPREYQYDGVTQLIRYIKDGYKRIVFQLPTGGGKTVCFSYFLQRYFKTFPSAIAKTIVHRTEIQQQTYKMFRSFNIDNVPVLMVETFFNTLKKGKYTATQVIIIDECHIGNFRKIVDYFPDAIIVGFSATPLSASKKHPLSAQYEKIVVCVGIEELIKLHDEDSTTGLVRGRHYKPKTDLNKSNIRKRSDEYSMEDMGIEFSRPKLIDTVIHNYKLYGEGKKALVFNTTIEHNNLVNEAFLIAGFNSRAIDSEHATDEERKEIFKWFKETDGSILNNIGIATTGYDEPSIYNIIVNRITLSLTLWHQMCGRGGRPFTGKNYFNIIDLGGNIDIHGPWHMKIDWENEFYHPRKPGSGIAPMKVCPNQEANVFLNGKQIFRPDGKPEVKPCGCMIYMAATKCEYCGFLMPREAVYSDLIIELELVQPDLIVPRNSPITHGKAVQKIAEKINKMPIFSREEKVGLLESSIHRVNEQSDYKQTSSFVLHLASKSIEA